ncbi:MAG: hypothetical protein QM597_06870 [Aeromicrobium sp.]|uniref:hypothetical protein n=1 Tax=Aeromicrobium sp. TaxID=1871063 RepID=UPI0039E24F53
MDRDARYRALLLEPLQTSADYLPKMGGSDEVDLEGFAVLYGSDPLYHWIGLDSPQMFAAHKAAGGMTSIYRQLGIGCERLFRAVLKDELSLADDQVTWSYEALPTSSSGKARVLSLDGRVDLGDVADSAAVNRIEKWIDAQRKRLNITADLGGAVFEVRQGYKSADSKRQNGDLANAAQALGHGYLPVLVIMSRQMNQGVRARYLNGRWSVLMGSLDPDPNTSTYGFLASVVGYDLIGFFERNAELLRAGTEEVLEKLLEAK